MRTTNTLARSCADFRRASAMRRYADLGACDDEQVPDLMDQYWKAARLLARTPSDVLRKAEALDRLLQDEDGLDDAPEVPRLTKSLVRDVRELVGRSN